MGDLDGDGDLDLVTAGPNGGPLSPNNIYYWSAANSRFEFGGSAYSLKAKMFYGNGSIVGDFNNDGKLDVIWASNSGKWYLGINSTTIADAITFSSINELPNTIYEILSGNGSLATGDFNNDGNLDVIAINADYNSGAYGGYYQLLYGNGDGTFNATIPAFGTDGYRSVSMAVGDVNKDGKLDFVLVRSKGNAASEVILYTRNVTNTGFDEISVYTSTNSSSGEIIIDDLNNDSHKDIIFQTHNRSYISILLNKGGGTFNTLPDLSIYASGKNQFLLYDIDGVGYKEIVALSPAKVGYYKVGYEPGLPTANNVNVVYDATEKTATATAPANASIVWYAASTGSTKSNAPTGTNAGTYSAYAASIDDETGFENTSRTLVELTISKGSLTVIGATAVNKVYDGTTAAVVTAAGLDGVIDGDVVTLANDVSGTFASKNVGTNIAVTTTMGITGADANNYVINQPTLKANITKSPIEITANNVSKQQNESDPILTYSITKGVLYNSDSFLGSLEREVGENLGNYNIQQGSLNAGNNYSISFIPAVFEIKDGALGVNNSLKAIIDLYPNPTIGTVNIKLDKTYSNVKINVRTIEGKLVQAIDKVDTNYISFDLEGNAGLYFIELTSEDGRAVFKILKE